MGRPRPPRGLSLRDEDDEAALRLIHQAGGPSCEVSHAQGIPAAPRAQLPRPARGAVVTAPQAGPARTLDGLVESVALHAAPCVSATSDTGATAPCDRWPAGPAPVRVSATGRPVPEGFPQPGTTLTIARSPPGIVWAVPMSHADPAIAIRGRARRPGTTAAR
jgi:hypothetical protein